MKKKSEIHPDNNTEKKIAAEKLTEIVSVKIIGFKKGQVICKTETDHILLIKEPQAAKKDRIFAETMLDLLKNGLWIPVNKKLKQFLQYDWLDERASFAL
ncbi:hypothetical protein [Liquorilactobacillus satsumensis]|uniref:Uncharacterized protein n=1 Tax=Liquorilactobacillus satsumensis DSM 16230 = JCM 12392 TaxID=1423801 RepID=A0A0R1UZP1_9LACO|nr:hypothetical protein [Liquorilactobacillus satsumensis]KRL98817.1 hypothetical protein FD50_GL000630 [Liquorilactobacillus satsumensis DSM 16230 = JCM 12392]